MSVLLAVLRTSPADSKPRSGAVSPLRGLHRIFRLNEAMAAASAVGGHVGQHGSTHGKDLGGHARLQVAPLAGGRGSKRSEGPLPRPTQIVVPFAGARTKVDRLQAGNRQCGDEAPCASASGQHQKGAVPAPRRQGNPCQGCGRGCPQLFAPLHSAPFLEKPGDPPPPAYGLDAIPPLAGAGLVRLQAQPKAPRGNQADDCQDDTGDGADVFRGRALWRRLPAGDGC